MKKKIFALALLCYSNSFAQYTSTANSVYYSDGVSPNGFYFYNWWLIEESEDEFLFITENDEFPAAIATIGNNFIRTEVCPSTICDTLFIADFDFTGIADYEICTTKLELTKRTSDTPSLVTDQYMAFYYNGSPISDNFANTIDPWISTFETTSYTVAASDFYIPLTAEIVNDPTFEIAILVSYSDPYCIGIHIDKAELSIEHDGLPLYIDTQIACNSFTWIDGYTYYGNNNTATFNAPSATGCDTLYQLDLTIEPTPEVILDGAYLTAMPNGVTYQWLDAGNDYAIVPNATMQNFLPPANGNYAIEITNGTCTDTSTYVVYNTFDIDESNKKPLLITPNPTQGEIAIDMENIPNATISLYNIHGQLLQSYDPITEKIFRAKLEVVAGIYFIQIQNEYTQQTQRIIVE